MSYNNPYQTDNPYADTYELRIILKRCRVDRRQSERTTINGGEGGAAAGTNTDTNDFVRFMNEINQINLNLDKYEQLINQIDVLHKNLLTEISEDREMELRHQLDDLVSQASDLQSNLKVDIKAAQQEGLHDTNKQAQAENSRQRFMKLINDYRVIEADYKEESKEQAKRQYRIVQPEATDEEVEAAISDVGGQQIFSQALLNANRRGEAKTALAEVQARHQELLKLEKTMAELTQLFNDMEQLVIEQQQNIEVIDKNVEEAQQDVEQGIAHTNKAVKSARRARRNKYRCIAICFVIVAVVVVVVVVPSVVETRK